MQLHGSWTTRLPNDLSLVIPQYSIGRSLEFVRHLLASQLVHENTSHLSDGPFTFPVIHAIDSSECRPLYTVLYRHICTFGALTSSSTPLLGSGSKLQKLQILPLLLAIVLSSVRYPLFHSCVLYPARQGPAHAPCLGTTLSRLMAGLPG